MSLDSIVKVNITRDTQVPTQAGFGVPAILSVEADALTAFDSIAVKVYEASTALESLIADGFTTGSQTYLAAVALLSQSPSIEKFKVIKQAASVAQVDRITISTVANNFTYEVTLNGVLYEFLSDADATDLEIQAGLIALLDAVTDISAVANATNQIDVSSDDAGRGFSLTVGSNLSTANTTPNNGPQEALIAASNEDDDWYFLLDTTHTKLQVELVAAYVETKIKLYGYQTNDSASKDSPASGDTTSTMGMLAAKAYDRTFGMWVPSGEFTQYKIAAWVGIMAPKDPGSATWKFKSGTGISANKFTAQEKQNILDKGGNVYITVAGIDMFEEGTAASGEFIDIMRGTDWIQARIQEQAFGLLVSNDKVPFTDGGIESIGLQVEDVLDRAVDRQILVGGEDGPVVTVPKRSETTKADRANRFLRDVKFTGNYAGAIHKVQIDGTLSV